MVTFLSQLVSELKENMYLCFYVYCVQKYGILRIMISGRVPGKIGPFVGKRNMCKNLEQIDGHLITTIS